MNKGNVIWAGIILGSVAVAALLRAAPEAAPAKVPEKVKAKVDAARRTHEVFWKDYKEGLVPVVEVVYRWSRRWLEAELELSDKKGDQVAAYQAHVSRIRELTRVARERYRVRTNTIEEVTAAEFYSLEADIWLEQARNKKG